MTYNNAQHCVRIREALRDTWRYQLHSSSLACGFPLALTHRRGKARGFTTFHPRDSPLTRISQERMGVKRRGETARIYTQANKTRVKFLFLCHGVPSYKVGDPLVTSRATTKLYELNGRYTLAPRNLQFTPPSRASRRAVLRRHTREKDAKLEH